MSSRKLWFVTDSCLKVNFSVNKNYTLCYKRPALLHRYYLNAWTVLVMPLGFRTLLHIFWACPKLTVRDISQKCTDIILSFDPAFFLLYLSLYHPNENIQKIHSTSVSLFIGRTPIHSQQLIGCIRLNTSRTWKILFCLSIIDDTHWNTWFYWLEFWTSRKLKTIILDLII